MMRIATRAIPAAGLPLILWALPAHAAVHAPPLGAKPQAATAASAVLHHVYNLDYSTGAISVFGLSGTQATLEHTFTPVSSSVGSIGGLAASASGLIYTTVDSPASSPCLACVEVFSPSGKVVAQVDAPTISGAPGPADLTDLAVDAKGAVFVTDYGQQAAYYFTPTSGGGYAQATMIETGAYAASVAVMPSAAQVYVQGNCGFGEARVYAQQSSGGYLPGNCFGLAEIALIGAAADNAGDIFTPVDAGPGLVSVGNAKGQGNIFSIPDRRGEIGSIALTHDGAVAYVADHRHERIYAFARPASGWISGAAPKLLARYTGFKNLNIIAIP